MTRFLISLTLAIGCGDDSSPPGQGPIDIPGTTGWARGDFDPLDVSTLPPPASECDAIAIEDYCPEGETWLGLGTTESADSMSIKLGDAIPDDFSVREIYCSPSGDISDRVGYMQFIDLDGGVTSTMLRDPTIGVEWASVCDQDTPVFCADMSGEIIDCP